MENAQEILVIIVSSVLTLFLLISIVLLILIIKLVLSVKRVVNKAEQLADKAEALGEFVQHATTPIMVGRILTNVFDKFTKGSKSKRRK